MDNVCKGCGRRLWTLSSRLCSSCEIVLIEDKKFFEENEKALQNESNELSE
jgi:ribosomal protein L37E